MSLSINLRRSAARTAFAAVIIAAFHVSTAMAVPSRAALSLDDALALLKANTGGALTSTHLPVDQYLTVHASGATPLLADDVHALPLDRARAFLSVYGALNGIKDSVAELSPNRISKDSAGNTHVHLDQMYQGLPVFGARVIVHMNDTGITGTNGVFIGAIGDLPITPQMSTSALQARAIAAAHKLHPKATLSVESSRLMVYRTGLLKGVEGRNYLAYEVMVKGKPTDIVREQLILNANTGAILNRINRIETVLNREIFTPSLAVPPVLTEGSVLAPADPAFAGDTKGNPA